MIDELELVRQSRPEVQVPDAEARDAARRALDRAIAGGAGPSRNRRWFGGLGRAIPALGVALAIGVAILFLTSAQTPMKSTRSTTPAGVTSPAQSTPNTAPPQDQNVLTGTWTGHSSGDLNGTLTITWQQSGWKERSRGVFHSNLGGSMKLSSLAGTLSIHGTVLSNCPTPPCTIPDAIRFKTVSGGPRISYRGTLQHSPAGGPVLSGSYQTPTGHGSWTVSQVGAP